MYKNQICYKLLKIPNNISLKTMGTNTKHFKLYFLIKLLTFLDKNITLVSQHLKRNSYQIISELHKNIKKF